MKYCHLSKNFLLISILNLVAIAVVFSSSTYASENTTSQSVILQFEKFQIEENIDTEAPLYVNYEKTKTTEIAEIKDVLTGTIVESVVVEERATPNPRYSAYQVTKTATHDGVEIKMVIQTTIYSSGGSFREFVI